MAAEVTAVRPSLNFSFSKMTEHDLLEVVEIEELSGLSPWGWEAYYHELGSAEGSLMLVARIASTNRPMNDARTIGGFIVSRVAADEMHVNNVAVRPEFRRQGIAAHLLGLALEHGKSRGVRTAFLEVRAGNVAAQQLYRRCGFAFTGRRKRYYSNPVEDALLMSAPL